MRLLSSLMICSLFTAVIICPPGYVLNGEKCYKKPKPPTILYVRGAESKPLKEGKKDEAEP